MYQEYTYKKITPCDVCREILRGKESGAHVCAMKVASGAAVPALSSLCPHPASILMPDCQRGLMFRVQPRMDHRLNRGMTAWDHDVRAGQIRG